jgi:FtsP/CotA-like multicopper oxidase with cupredoxin domain
VVASADAAEPGARLPSSPIPLPPYQRCPGSASVTPVRTRKLYFSEKLTDPKDPNSATEFYITVDGQEPKMFDPHSGVADIVTHQGDVEDWIIENRSTELHAFHIHQLHFLLIDWSGIPVNEPFLRDTVNVPYFAGRMLKLSERAAADGFSRSRFGRYLRLPLPPARARGRRHDGPAHASSRRHQPR